MAQQPETVLVGKIRAAIKKEWPEAWVFKVAGGPYQMVGVPDLLVCVKGRLIGLEVKKQRPGESEEHARGRATVLQLAQIQQIIAAGGHAAVVLTPEEALAEIRKVL